MIGYRLSRTGTARNPFYITHIGAGLWSVEELCFYICTNPALIDGTVLNDLLVRWLAEEFRLTTIALSMEKGIRGRAGTADIVIPLLRGTGYLDARELKQFMKVLAALDEGGPSLRLKMKGDALARNHRYGEAVAIYTQGADQAKPDERRLLASIFHNRGTALMQLLQFEEGFESFREACLIEATPGRCRDCLMAALLANPEADLEAVAMDLGADEEVLFEAMEAVEEAEKAPQGAEGDTLSQLEFIRSSYHQEAGT